LSSVNAKSRISLRAIDVEGMDHRMDDDVVAADVGQLGWKILELFYMVLNRRTVHFSKIGFPKL